MCRCCTERVAVSAGASFSRQARGRGSGVEPALLELGIKWTQGWSTRAAQTHRMQRGRETARIPCSQSVVSGSQIGDKQSSDWYLLPCCFLAEEMLLRNVSWMSADYMTLYARRQSSSWSPVWEPKILWKFSCLCCGKEWLILRLFNEQRKTERQKSLERRRKQGTILPNHNVKK